MKTYYFAIALSVTTPGAVCGQVSNAPTLQCLKEGKPACQSNSDCADSTSVFGANVECGNVLCDVSTGTCTYNAWQSTGHCADTSYVQCGGNDGHCTKGPTGLSFEGRCNGWNNEECMYYWCPKGGGTVSTTQAAMATTTTASTTSAHAVDTTSTSPPATTTPAPGSGPCCTSNDDCIKYPGASPLLTTCGVVRCNTATSACEYDAWNDSAACRDEFFVWCGDADSGSMQDIKDARCTKGPAGNSGAVVGKCTLFGGNECSYTYCPGGGGGGTTAVATSSTTTAAPVTTAATTSTTTTVPVTSATTDTSTTITAITSSTTTEATSAITTAPPMSTVTTTSSSTFTTQVLPDTCCLNVHDCKADIGQPQLFDCGEPRCENNQCVFITRHDKDYCNTAYLVECLGNDSLCNRGPAGSAGKCDIDGGTLCSYRWCPGASTSGPTQPPILPPVTGGTFWRPPQIQTWDWQLYNDNRTVDYSRDVDVYDVDLFTTTPEHVKNIKTKGGTITDPARYRKVICYFSAGSYENWRPDKERFPEEVKGVFYYGFPNEQWLDIRRFDILGPIMSARLDMARDKGCDAVEPDNMDVYDDTAHEASGFPLTYQDQINYNVWLSEQAHIRGMAVGLKNNINQAAILEPYFEFVVSEQCVEYGECKNYQKFIDAGKPIFLAEYSLEPQQFCGEAALYKAMAIKKTALALEYEACPPWWGRRERGLRGDWNGAGDGDGEPSLLRRTRLVLGKETRGDKRRKSSWRRERRATM